MLIMLLLIRSDCDDPIQCCTSVVDYGPALNMHWFMVSWSLCGVYTLKDLKPTWDAPAGDDRPELKRSLNCKLAADQVSSASEYTHTKPFFFNFLGVGLYHRGRNTLSPVAREVRAVGLMACESPFLQYI